MRPQIASRSDDASSQKHLSIMSVPSVRKKRLATYSKKTLRIDPRSTFASPTSHDRQTQRRRVTLTSPVREANLPTSPSSLSLSPESGHGDEEHQAPEKVSPSKTRKRGRELAKPLQAHEHTSTQSSSRANSPVSSSENDSISDASSIPVIVAQRQKRPRLLTTLRKSLNLQAKKSRIIQQRPTTALSAATLKEVHGGADGFDEIHLVPITPVQRKSKKRSSRLIASRSMLEVRKGPHPPVHFDHPEWSMVPYQIAQDDKQAEVFETIESVEGVAKIEAAAAISTVSAHAEGEKVESAPKSPTSPNKPSIKDISLYAQLSSVSAPIVRRGSNDEDSENDLDHGLTAEEEDDAFEEEADRADQEEARDRTVR
ncbi:hypothetical protein D6D00_01894 [Aureobasidium pullulans]|nr:hypothetical protein D6D00_01894 [Aureobasidium pullulans]